MITCHISVSHSACLQSLEGPLHARLVPHQSMEGKGGRPRAPVRHIGAYRETKIKDGRREGRRPGNRQKNHQGPDLWACKQQANKTARAVLPLGSFFRPSSEHGGMGHPSCLLGREWPLPRGLDSHCYSNCCRSRKSWEAAGGREAAESVKRPWKVLSYSG